MSTDDVFVLRLQTPIFWNIFTRATDIHYFSRHFYPKRRTDLKPVESAVKCCVSKLFKCTHRDFNCLLCRHLAVVHCANYLESALLGLGSG